MILPLTPLRGLHGRSGHGTASRRDGLSYLASCPSPHLDCGRTYVGLSEDVHRGLGTGEYAHVLHVTIRSARTVPLDSYPFRWEVTVLAV